MRNPTLRTLLVAASIGALPTVLAAQQPAKADTVTQTHTVVKGETLWGLAQQYLSDPFRWPEIYNLNKSLIADPHWIYPGQTLRIPGSGTVLGVTVTMAPPGGAPAVSAVGADTGMKADTLAGAADTTAKAGAGAKPALTSEQELNAMNRSTVFTPGSPPRRPRKRRERRRLPCSPRCASVSTCGRRTSSRIVARRA